MNKAKRLEELQTRVRRGDAGAEDELRRELEPWVAWMVRRMMRLPPAGSPLESLIQAAMHRLPADFATQSAAENPRIARQIAQRVCLTLINRLRSQPSPPEWGRVRVGGNRQDTVRDWRSVREQF
jgi:hypothetical protein